MSEYTWQETIEGEAGHLVKTVEGMIAEGNVRKISITHGARTVAEFPLTLGVVGGVVGLVLAPVLAAVGAIAAIATDCKIHVERVGARPDPSPDPSSDPRI